MDVWGTVLLVVGIAAVLLSCIGAVAIVASDNNENINLPTKIYKWLFYGGLILVAISFVLSQFN